MHLKAIPTGEILDHQSEFVGMEKVGLAAWCSSIVVIGCCSGCYKDWHSSQFNVTDINPKIAGGILRSRFKSFDQVLAPVPQN